MNHFKNLLDSFRQRTVRVWNGLPAPARRVAPMLAVLLVGLWLGNVLFSERHQQPSEAEIAAGPDQAEEIWTCSMHPSIRQHEPGNCPICGMALIPVAGGGGHDHGDLPILTVSEQAAALMSVQVWPAERRGLNGEVRLSGRIDFDERAVHEVIVRTQGQVERLYVNYASASVSRGQRLADIYSPAILAASQELLQARRAAERGGSPALVEAARTQLMLLGVTEGQIEQILESGQPARTFTVYSPAAGVVSNLSARQGEWLGDGARLMQVAGLGQLWAQFDAYESDLGRLAVGRPLRFTVDAFPGESFEGRIGFIDPVVDGARRTARVRVQLANPGGRLKPGMLARAVAAAPVSAEAPLVIPTSAPLITGRRTLVYVQLTDHDEPTFEAREVELGSRDGGFWEVRSGLLEGDLVVVNGAFKIDSELQIRGRSSLMSPGQAPAPRGHDHGEMLPLAGAPTGDVDLGDVARAYLALTDALVDSDAGAARSAAGRMAAALEAVPADSRDWRRQRGMMNAPLVAMQRSGSDLEEIRAQLQPLSTALEAAVQQHGSPVTLHRASCPMAFDNTGGSWLQRDGSTVANPYFGDAMLTCGSVETRVAG